MVLTYNRMYLPYNMTSRLLLGPASRAAVIARTFLDPDQEFYLRELVRLSGFALRTVQEEVDRLVAADLLTERRHGNRRYLSANKRHPLFRPVREIVLKTDGLVNVLRDALGVEQVDFALVFGSIASDTPSAASDVDVLVVGDVTLRQVVRRFSSVQDVLGREVNPVVWTREEFEQRRASDDHFLADVLSEPIIMIVGDGVVGRHAASVSAAMGAEVYLFGLSAERGEALRAQISRDLNYVVSTPESLAAHARDADLLVGAVLVEGARAPHLISSAMVSTMPEGSVIVDVSIDQGGCVETSRPTSHSEPTFVDHGVIYYCVSNMPGAYPRTSTFALTDATLPYVSRIADQGLAAFSEDAGFGSGVNTLDGFLTCLPVAEALEMQDRYRSLSEMLA